MKRNNKKKIILFCFSSGLKIHYYICKVTHMHIKLPFIGDLLPKSAHEILYAISISLCSSFPDAIYDCASLYGKSYRISGEYKLPKDEFLGAPELSVSQTVLLDSGLLSTQHSGTVQEKKKKMLFCCRSTVIWRQTAGAGLWFSDAKLAWPPSAVTGSSTRTDLDPSEETSGLATTTSIA